MCHTYVLFFFPFWTSPLGRPLLYPLRTCFPLTALRGALGGGVRPWGSRMSSIRLRISRSFEVSFRRTASFISFSNSTSAARNFCHLRVAGVSRKERTSKWDHLPGMTVAFLLPSTPPFSFLRIGIVYLHDIISFLLRALLFYIVLVAG